MLTRDEEFGFSRGRCTFFGGLTKLIGLRTKLVIVLEEFLQCGVVSLFKSLRW